MRRPAGMLAKSAVILSFLCELSVSVQIVLSYLDFCPVIGNLQLEDTRRKPSLFKGMLHCLANGWLLCRRERDDTGTGSR